jgi:hypothetical protein
MHCYHPLTMKTRYSTRERECVCVCVTMCVYCICAYGYSAVNTLFVYSACVWECVYAYVCVLHLCAWIFSCEHAFVYSACVCVRLCLCVSRIGFEDSFLVLADRKLLRRKAARLSYSAHSSILCIMVQPWQSFLVAAGVRFGKWHM